MVKRESLELGAQRNWLLTRTSPTSNAETYTQSQWQNPPRCSQRRSMPDARLQAPGGRLDDLLAAVKKALRLYSEASRPLLPPLQLAGMCAQRSSEAAWGYGAEAMGNFAVDVMWRLGIGIDSRKGTRAR